MIADFANMGIGRPDVGGCAEERGPIALEEAREPFAGFGGIADGDHSAVV